MCAAKPSNSKRIAIIAVVRLRIFCATFKTMQLYKFPVAYRVVDNGMSRTLSRKILLKSFSHQAKLFLAMRKFPSFIVVSPNAVDVLFPMFGNIFLGAFFAFPKITVCHHSMPVIFGVRFLLLAFETLFKSVHGYTSADAPIIERI
jgi:hypothetical protein